MKVSANLFVNQVIFYEKELSNFLDNFYYTCIQMNSCYKMSFFLFWLTCRNAEYVKTYLEINGVKYCVNTAYLMLQFK